MRIEVQLGITHVVVDMDGVVRSRHRSRDAAERAIKREMAGFLASPYSRGGAYLPRSIIAVRDGVAYLSREKYSTTWCTDE